MPKSNEQKIWKRWNKKLREMKKLADEGHSKAFLAETILLRQSLERFEQTQLTQESDGARQINLQL